MLYDALWHVPEDLSVGYVDSEDYNPAYGGHDPMVNNE